MLRTLLLSSKSARNILLQVMDLAKELGVEFAFPTRTLRVETLSAASASSEPNAGTMLAAQ